MLPPALYGCETWFLTLRKEHRLGVFEKTVLSKICGPMLEEATADRSVLHNEELYDLYSSPNTIRLIKESRCRWGDNIKTDLQDVGWGHVLN